MVRNVRYRMVMVTPTTRRLARADWAMAALSAIAETGMAGVAVEPLARRLATTKGSFYWHFANREALIEAALELWEQEHTEAVIVRVEEETDPLQRLRLLLTTAIMLAQEDVIDAAVLASARHPLVAPALDRVTERRVGYLAQLFRQLGFPPVQARDRGLLAYTAYLGQSQLIQAGLSAVPADGAALRRYVDRILGILTAPD
ncbi:MAG: TetR/AcrR family transcriptional regulator [Geodermatophilaceae bacterium]|nr:TetR/AcrR family transcriptional regulator [Geodermatophilaceae bacterium]